MNKNEKISDETLIAYLEKQLDSKTILRVEEALKNDMNLFSRYAVLNRSFNQIEKENFEVAPDILKEKLNDELRLSSLGEEEGITETVDQSWFSTFLQNFLKPGPVFGTVLSAFLIIFLFQTKHNQSQKSREIDTFLNSLKKMSNNKNSNSISNELSGLSNKSLTEPLKTSMKGFSINFTNDTLVISQTISIKRQVHLINIEKNHMESFIIEKKENRLNVNKEFGSDSLRLIIETEKYIVYDNWLRLE